MDILVQEKIAEKNPFAGDQKSIVSISITFRFCRFYSDDNVFIALCNCHEFIYVMLKI